MSLTAAEYIRLEAIQAAKLRVQEQRRLKAQGLEPLEALPSEKLAQGLDECAPYKVNYENQDDPLGLRARQQESEKRNALGRIQKRTRPRHESLTPCDQYFITFRIFSCQPMDWDNPSTKELQDALRRLYFLPGDDWRQLQGRVITEKAPTRQHERTEIEIELLEKI